MSIELDPVATKVRGMSGREQTAADRLRTERNAREWREWNEKADHYVFTGEWLWAAT